MSLHFLGIRDFPVLYRQFSSPTTKITDSPALSQVQEKDHDLARDSKDVLIQRLNDLSYRLMNSEGLENEAVTALHIDVDRMEKIIRTSRGASPESSFKEEKSIVTPRPHEEDAFWGPFSPSRNISMRLPDSPTQRSPLRPRLKRESAMSPSKAGDLTTQAGELMKSLGRTVEELKTRKEETDHIHTLLVTRAEHAAQRVIELEGRVKELDIDFEESQSELSYLRLQMRALEVQGMEYIPFNADEDLSQSIKNWKLDWADVDQRTKARRRKCKDGVGDSDDSQTVVDEH